uniref:Uncharacterized protein n=1 Tax=Seriola dumerili TaxID=41447 RepID=A0A3B4UJD8_SERDU
NSVRPVPHEEPYFQDVKLFTCMCSLSSSSVLPAGWHWYYRRYIDVRKGGVGGLGMLVAGYCVLSYIWSYPHIKRDRWRKYH